MARVPPERRRRLRDRDRQPLAGRHDRGARGVRARGPRPPDPRARRGPAPGRVGDAHGAPRGDRVRRRLGDQLRRGRVLVAARRLAVARCSAPCRRATGRSARSCACSARDPATEHVRRADDRALLGARADQRPGVALQADPQDRPSRASRDPGHAREPRAGGQPVRAAARLVPDRVLPLPAALGRPVRAQGASSRARRSRSTSRDRRPRTTRDMYAALRSGRIAEYYESLVVSDDELERGVGPGHGSSSTRGCATRSGQLRDVGRLPAPSAPLVPAPDARRGRRVRGRGGRARRGRRRPAPAAARRARAPAPDASSSGCRGAPTGSSRVPRSASSATARARADAQPVRFTARTPTITS